MSIVRLSMDPWLFGVGRVYVGVEKGVEGMRVFIGEEEIDLYDYFQVSLPWWLTSFGK